MMALLDQMAFYKLNYLQWDGKAACSEEEVKALLEHARDLGIHMVGSRGDNASLEVFVAKDNNADGLFLQKVSAKGGVLVLEGNDETITDALLAFAERYWRGGDAGEGSEKNGTPELLSPAGSRLANFKEKMALHHNRYLNK